MTDATRRRRPTRYRLPVANPPVCWGCDERLYAGGRSYVLAVAEDGHEHPYHHECAPSATEDA